MARSARVPGKTGAINRHAPTPGLDRVPTAPATKLGYRPALDGLRALAVVAVVLYHAGARWIPGGFLGVEVFFVISGFLITTLLREEFERTDRIDLRAFWTRRARRLLPALYLMVVAVCAVALTWAPDAVRHLKGDTVAAFAYVTNWYSIIAGQSYFDALGRPPLLRHLWSLAIEEQWYLIWPLAFVVMLRIARRAQRLVPVLVALGVASAVLMAVLYRPDHDPSRVYYGTDTRASGLLLGAALACGFTPWRAQRGRSAQRAREPRGHSVAPRPATAAHSPIRWAGPAALVGLGWCVWSYDEVSPGLYRGGFLLVDVLSVVAIAAAVHPSGRRYQRVLSSPPLRYLGTRSYGLYLWHWPVLMLTRPSDWAVNGTVRFVAQMALSLVLTEASYRLVELPVRQGVIGRWWSTWREYGPRGASVLATRAGAAMLVGGLALGVVGLDLARTVPPDPLAGPAAAPFVLSAVVSPTPGGATSETDGDAATGEVSGEPGGAAAGEALGEAAGEVPGEAGDGVVANTVAAIPVPTSAAAVAADVAPPIVATQENAPILPRRVVVVGDSVGKTLVRNMPVELAATLTVTSGAIEGCGLVDGAIKTTARWRVSFSGCGDVPARWTAAVLDAHAQVVVVTVGAWEVFDLRRDEGDLTFGSPEWVTYMRERLDVALAALASTGAHVALLEVPCFRPVDGGGLKALPERGDDTRTRLLNDMLRDAATSDPARVAFLPGPPGLCSDPVATNLDYRWDGVHYYRPGASLVWSTITPSLLALPVSTR
jgi:peptidoglycan/LPS O-acetylase OafA/YrhL